MITDSGLEYDRSNIVGPTTVAASGEASTITTFKRCLLTGDSLSVGNVGSTASTKYSFSAMYRDPA